MINPPGYAKAYYDKRKIDPNFRRIKWAAKIYTLYRLRSADYQALLDKQDGKCAICKADLISPEVDHDHSCCPGSRSCGKCIRGLLCSFCNRGIAHLREDPKIFLSALRYLEAK